MDALNHVIHFEGSERITIRNGTGLNIETIGSTTLNTNSHALILKNVMHVPRIASWFIYDENEFFVPDKTIGIL